MIPLSLKLLLASENIFKDRIGIMFELGGVLLSQFLSFFDDRVLPLDDEAFSVRSNDWLSKIWYRHIRCERHDYPNNPSCQN